MMAPYQQYDDYHMVPRQQTPLRAPIENFDQFDEFYGRDVANAVFQRVCEACYSRENKDAAVYVSERHRHDAVNYTYTGTYTHADGIEYSFQIDDGNRNGTEIQHWSETTDANFVPPEPPRYMFVPVNDDLEATRPGMWAVYQGWTKQPWFQDKLRGYHYDSHFAPGEATERHYREWAASKGLKIQRMGDES